MAASVESASPPASGTFGRIGDTRASQLGAGRVSESSDAAPGSARNNAATPRSPFSQPDLQTSPAKAPNDRLRLPVLESLEDHELSGLTSLTGSELNLYLQVTEEMKREEPAMARRLLQSASFKRRQSQAEAAAAAPNGPAPASSAAQPRASGALPQGSISSTSSASSSRRSSASQQQLSKELSDAVERLRGILPADAVGLEHRNSFGLLDLLSSASLADPETAAAANVLAAHQQQQQQGLEQQQQVGKQQQQQPLTDIGNSNIGNSNAERAPQSAALQKLPTSGASSREAEQAHVLK